MSRHWITVIGWIALVGMASSNSFAAANPPAKPLLVVLCKADNELAIVDPDSMTVTQKLPTGVGPHEVAVSPDAKTAYVANYGDQKSIGNTLTVVDLVERKVTRTVDLGVLRRPHGLAVARDGKVWFTAELNAVVGRYDPAAEKVDAIIGTGQALSHMVARDPVTGKLFTANIVADSVTVIDPRGSHPKPVHIAAHQGPEGIAISPDGKSLWVGHVKSGDIAVIDTTTSQVTDTLETDGGVPIRLTFTPDGKRVLASDAKGGAVLIYDAATKKQLGRIEVGNTPVGVTVSHDGKRAFVATTGDGRVSRVDLDTLQVTKSADVGQQPDGIAWAQPLDASARAAG
jgi:YVTN family beta-propeller protein